MVTTDQVFTTFETRLGFVAMAWNDHGIRGLRLPSLTVEAAERALLKRLPEARRDATPPPDIADAVGAVVRYFAGEKIDFSEVRIDLGAQEPFMAGVYSAVRRLRWGETTTYGAIAKGLGGEPQAARDVGQAMATNPIPLIVPCHRVLAAGGKIGGFSAPGGAGTKAKMLALEGAAPSPAVRKDQSRRSSGQASFPFVS